MTLLMQIALPAWKPCLPDGPHTEFSRAAELLLPRSVCFYPLCRMLIVKSAIRHRLQQCNCAILLGRTLI